MQMLELDLIIIYTGNVFHNLVAEVKKGPSTFRFPGVFCAAQRNLGVS